MVTEFEIRSELARIDALDCAPLQRARQLLKLARAVRKGAARLRRLSSALMQDSEGECAARMYEAARRLWNLSDEIRGAAYRALKGSAPLAIGGATRDSSHPRWLMELAGSPGTT